VPIDIDHRDDGEDDSTVVGFVEIDGPWRGRVTVSCSEQLATTITAQMFEMDPAETTKAELVDAMGEIANMIGGNVKALLPGPSKLSLPLVYHGQAITPTADDSGTTWTFTNEGERFCVTMVGGAREGGDDVDSHSNDDPGQGE
jgi:CheY-specific phosphatase CheX